MKDRIREVMESKHMSQQEFAQYIDMSPASLSSIFNGRTQPTLKIVEAIKRKFHNISTDWLMFGSGSMYESSADGESTASKGDEDGRGHIVGLEASLDFDTPLSPTPQAGSSLLTGGGDGRTNHKEAGRGGVKYIDKPQRKVMEIRVYYDDLTFESFVPSKK